MEWRIEHLLKIHEIRRNPHQIVVLKVDTFPFCHPVKSCVFCHLLFDRLVSCSLQYVFCSEHVGPESMRPTCQHRVGFGSSRPDGQACMHACMHSCPITISTTMPICGLQSLLVDPGTRRTFHSCSMMHAAWEGSQGTCGTGCHVGNRIKKVAC
jgi:hypothetical protein